MKLTIDVSYYNNLSKAQWDLLATVLDGVTIRLCYGVTEDVMADEHIEQATRVGLPYNGYHWADPTWGFPDQQGRVLESIDKFKPASMMNDYEQYWKDWAAYMRGDYAKAYATRFTPTQLDSFYKKFQTFIVTNSLIPIGQYSADWFINKYTPTSAAWMKQGMYWEAKYLKYSDPAYLSGMITKWGSPFDIQHVKELAAYASTRHIGVARQFESFLPIKGLYEGVRYHVDWNVWDDEPFYKMFKVAPTPGEVVVPPSLPPVVVPPLTSFIVTAWAVNVRRTPGGAIFAWKVKGNVVQSTENVNGWEHITNPDGWVYQSALARL